MSPPRRVVEGVDVVGDGVTVGELGRRLNDIAGRLENVIVRFDTTYVRMDLFLSTTNGLDKRVEDLEARSEWLVRTVGAFIIITILGAIFAYVRSVGH